MTLQSLRYNSSIAGDGTKLGRVVTGVSLRHRLLPLTLASGEKNLVRVVSGLAAIAASLLSPPAEASLSRPPSRSVEVRAVTIASSTPACAPDPSEFSLFVGDEIFHALRTYGPADEFTQIVDTNAGTSELPTSGPEGRLEKKGTTTYTYDLEGRRIENARFLYTWDFRSRLVRAESRQAATQGEVVDYAYDALGRLLTRTHRGALPSGSLDETKRPFKAQRGYLWDGDTLLDFGAPGYNARPATFRSRIFGKVAKTQAYQQAVGRPTSTLEISARPGSAPTPAQMQVIQAAQQAYPGVSIRLMGPSATVPIIPILPRQND